MSILIAGRRNNRRPVPIVGRAKIPKACTLEIAATKWTYGLWLSSENRNYNALYAQNMAYYDMFNQRYALQAESRVFSIFNRSYVYPRFILTIGPNNFDDNAYYLANVAHVKDDDNEAFYFGRMSYVEGQWVFQPNQRIYFDD